MALTATTPMEAVELVWDDLGGNIREVRWVSDESSQQSGLIALPVVSGSSDADDLETLQEIYASEDGFQDSDDNNITGRVYQLAGITDADDLESKGYANPLIAGFMDRVANREKVGGAFLMHAEVETDDTTGRADIKTAGGITPKRGAPLSGSLKVSLRDFLVSRQSATEVNFRLLVPVEENITTTDELYAYPPLRAFLAWLEANRDTGSAVGTSGALLARVSSRNFIVDQGSPNDVTFTISGVAHTVPGASTPVEFIEFTATEASDTDDPLEVNSLNNTMDEATATLTGVTESVEEPPFGEDMVAVHGLRHYYGQKAWTQWLHDHLVLTAQANGQKFQMVVGGGYGRPMQFSDLGGSPKRLPVLYGVNVIEFTDSDGSSGTVQIDDPTKTVLLPGNDRLVLFHNRSVSGLFYLHDWDSNRICTLLPGERVEFRIVRHLDGSGELLFTNPLRREFRRSGDDVGNFGDNARFNISTLTSARAIPISNEQSFSHEDAFEVASGSISSGTDYDDLLSLFVDDAVKVLVNGSMRYELELNYASANSGWIPSGNGPRLFRERGSVRTTVFHPDRKGIGSYQNGNLQIFWEGDIEDDDVFLPAFAYSTSGTTMDIERSYNTVLSLADAD